MFTQFDDATRGNETKRNVGLYISCCEPAFTFLRCVTLLLGSENIWRAVCVKTNFIKRQIHRKLRTVFERRIEFYLKTNSLKRESF